MLIEPIRSRSVYTPPFACFGFPAEPRLDRVGYGAHIRKTNDRAHQVGAMEFLVLACWPSIFSRTPASRRSKPPTPTKRSASWKAAGILRCDLHADINMPGSLDGLSLAYLVGAGAGRRSGFLSPSALRISEQPPLPDGSMFLGKAIPHLANYRRCASAEGKLPPGARHDRLGLLKASIGATSRHAD